MKLNTRRAYDKEIVLISELILYATSQHSCIFSLSGGVGM